MNESKQTTAPFEQPRAPKAPAFLTLYRPRQKQWLWALAVLILILVVFRHEAMTRLTTHFLGGSERDAGLYIWLLQSNSQKFFSLPWFNTPAFYPYSQTLAWSDNFLLPSLIAAPFLYIGLPLPLIFNVLILGANLLSGLLTYRLVFALCGHQRAALLAGSFFMTYSFLAAHLGHPQLQFAFFLPLSLLVTFRFIARPTRFRAIGLGLIITAAFLTTVYYAFFVVLGILLVAVSVLILKPETMMQRVYLLRAPLALIGILPILPFAFPYLAVRDTFGARYLHEAFYFSASALSYLAAPQFNFLYRWTASLSHNEAQLFPGVGILVLVSLAAFRAFGSTFQRRTLIATIASLFICGIFSTPFCMALVGDERIANYGCAFFSWITAISLGVLLWQLGRTEERVRCNFLSNRALLAVSIFGLFTTILISFGPRGYGEEHGEGLALYRLLYEALPGFNAIRAIGRIGILGGLFFSLAAGLAYAHYDRVFSLPRWFGVLIIGFVVFENFTPWYPVETLAPRPEIFQKLDEVPPEARGAVLVLPLSGELDLDRNVKSWSEFARLNVNAMLWTLPTGMPLVNGYSGQRSKLMKDFPRRLQGFPNADSLRAIGDIAGVRYVVLLSRALTAESPSLLGTFPGSLRLMHTDRAGNLLFEYTGTRVMDVDGATLLVPSFPAGKLQVELSLLPQTEIKETEIQVIANEVGADETLQTLLVPADGTWRNFEIKIPQSNTTVAPRKLRFSKGAAKIPERSLYLRRTHYSNEK